jgi:DNA repair exonuclease SbcCD ATPase subunit
MSGDFRDSIIEIESKVSSLNREFDTLKGSTETLKEVIEEGKEKIDNLRKLVELDKKCIEVLDVVQKSVREGTKKTFESIVGYALQSILGDGYNFRFEFKRRGNYQEVDINIITPSMEEPFDPLDSCAGGAIDVVSLALRVCILSLYKPKIEGPLIFDESFKHVSSGLLENAGEFLNALAERIGRQIIMVTHKSLLVNFADNVIQL